MRADTVLGSVLGLVLVWWFWVGFGLVVLGWFWVGGFGLVLGWWFWVGFVTFLKPTGLGFQLLVFW